jgi:hypothetical protein
MAIAHDASAVALLSGGKHEGASQSATSCGDDVDEADDRYEQPNDVSKVTFADAHTSRIDEFENATA